MKLANPRDFVKSIPIPVPIDKGIKIQARCFNVYNTTVPERSIVRKENYDRRQTQINSMGFSSQVNQPYKILGEPFYLDQKKVILHALGQLNNSEDSDADFFYDAENENEIKAEIESPTISRFTFASLRKDKKLVDLNSELTKTNNLIRSVKLGQSVFDLIEENERENTKIAEEEKIKESGCMTLRPMEDSDEDFDDRATSASSYRRRTNEPTKERLLLKSSEALDQENYVPGDEHRASGLHDLRKSYKSDGFRQNNLNSMQTQSVVSSSTFRSHSTSKRKGNKDPPKPYALVYTSLVQNSKTDFQMDGQIITRQLCVLLWLLECINVEPPNAIGPFRTCFLIKELGGTKMTEKSLSKSKVTDQEWINFKKNQGTSKQYSGKPHVTREERIRNRRMTMRPNESIVTDDTASEDENRTTRGKENNLDNHSQESFSVSQADNKQRTVRGSITMAQSLPSNLNNQKDSTIKEEASKETVQPRSSKDHNPSINLINLTSSEHRLTRSALPSVPKQHQKKVQIEIEVDHGLSAQDIHAIKIGDPDEMERVLSKVTFKNERKDAKNLRADCGPIRPYWSQAVLDYQKTLPSLRKSKKLLEIKDKFIDIKDQNSIELNNRLEEIKKRRLKSCITKFTFMDPKERGVHNMLKKLNERMSEKQRLEDLRKTPSSQFHKWYLDIEYLVETHYDRNECYMKLILERLANYAKLSSKKMNETKFFTTLENLRSWEFLSPDVMSAVEFCRERILDIKPEDFDMWFQTRHPNFFVPRPAPLKRDNNQSRRVKTAVD